MTFRSRLLLSIVGVVVGTTAISLYIAQTQNQSSYRAVVDEMFRREASSFQREQQASLTVASTQSARLAESVRLFAALEAGDESVYQVARDEMRLGDFSFFRLASADGTLVTPPAEHDGLEPAANKALAAQLQPLPSASDKETPTSIGFVALPENGATGLYRVLLSPIAQTFEDQRHHMGWLVLGQRFVHHDGAGKDAAVRSGILLDGRLISESLPTDIAAQVTHGSTITLPTGEHRVSSVVLNPDSNLPKASLVTLFSLKDFHERQRSLTWRIVGMGLLALFFATLIASALSRQLAAPIRRMVGATEQIRSGDFNIQLPPDRTDEINTLAMSLNEMASDLALKERYQSILHMVADEQVAQELIHGDLRLGGELRQVTTIFCDIRGYTSMSAGMNPADVIALLNDHMSALTHIVHQRRGVVKQFTGDGIMILFGAPKSYGSDAVDAARCALEMMQERHRLNATVERPLHIGIGIATGEVLAGCLGAEHRAEYTVVGERVNLAARLCSAAAAGEILVDDTTRSQWPEGVFTSEPLPPLPLKGYPRPVPAWQLLLPSTQAS